MFSVAVGIAVRLIFLTAQRPLQVSGMRLDELIDLDGPAPCWDLWAESMSTDLPMKVPGEQMSAETVAFGYLARALVWNSGCLPERPLAIRDRRRII